MGIYLAMTDVRILDATKEEPETQDPFVIRQPKFMTVK